MKSDLEFDAQRQALAEEVDRVLGNPAADGESDPRDGFERLGAARLLAVHWPPAYGGRGLSLADHAAVSERVGWHGLPDVPHLVSIQGVGCTLLTEGTEQQRARWLAPLAQGEAFASLLLSEEGAGTDLGAIQCRASRDGEGFVVTGTKAWNLFADWSAFGLCCARTRPGSRAHDGLSLLIVPFDAPGVSVEAVGRTGDSPYQRVVLDDVRIDADALVGEEHRSLPLVLRAIGFERAGFDYLNRAHRWLAACNSLVPAVAPHTRLEAAAALIRHETAVFAARALAYRAATSATGVDMDDGPAAIAKVATSEAAQNLAWWAATSLLPALDETADPAAVQTLHAALAEAPELSISGGANDLHLDAIASEPVVGAAA